MGVYSHYDVVDKYLYCRECQDQIHENLFPSCMACDDRIKLTSMFGCYRGFLCENHSDNYKHDYGDARIYLCECCLPRFKRYDKGTLRCIDYGLELLEANKTFDAKYLNKYKTET
jgi:hypothetical protein